MNDIYIYIYIYIYILLRDKCVRLLGITLKILDRLATVLGTYYVGKSALCTHYLNRKCVCRCGLGKETSSYPCSWSQMRKKGLK